MGERCTVEGTVQSVIFQNEENGYTVLSLLTELGEVVTVVGCIPYAAPGEGMTITGVWVTHPLYGPQITCEQAERRLPRDEAEMVCYLASGILKGVGQATAERMVDAFGTDTLRVLEEEPERLSRIKGITAKKAMELSQAFRELTGLQGFSPGTPLNTAGASGGAGPPHLWGPGSGKAAGGPVSADPAAVRGGFFRGGRDGSEHGL